MLCTFYNDVIYLNISFSATFIRNLIHSKWYYCEGKCSLRSMYFFNIYLSKFKLIKNICSFDNNQRCRNKFTMHFWLKLKFVRKQLKVHRKLVQGRFFLSDGQINLASLIAQNILMMFIIIKAQGTSWYRTQHKGDLWLKVTHTGCY